MKQEKFRRTVYRILMLLIFQLLCVAIPNMLLCVRVYVYGAVCAWSSKSHPNPACAVYLNDTATTRNNCSG